MKSTTVATLFAIIGTTTSFNPQPSYDGRHSHPNTASYNSLRDMASYPETFENGFGHRQGGGGGGHYQQGGGFDNGNWRTNAGYSQGPGGYRDMETNPYYDEGWSQSARPSRGGPMGGDSFGRRGGAGGPMGGAGPHRSADGFDPFGAYSPAMGMSRSDRRMDQGDLFMNSDSMGMRSDRTMRGFTYDGRNRDYGGMDGRREYGMDPGMMFEDPEFGPPGMMGGMDGGMQGGMQDMGMMGGGGSMGMGGGMQQGMGRMGP